MSSFKRLRRSESFFGLHFDFHASDKCNSIGVNTHPQIIEYIAEVVKPDFVQCDCKGHPGFSSYPTKVGNAAPGIVKDGLKIWREATNKYGVALYIHYSSVVDKQAAKLHPEWARIKEDGTKDDSSMSTFGDYSDQLLIPQLKELCSEYDIDGVWLDGECWGAKPDYCSEAIEIFKNKTGLGTIPVKTGDEGFYEFLEICRESFRKYVRHYTDELHRFNQSFQICSNWAFTSFMPEPVSANLDFLSGDFMPVGSVNSARFEARCLASQGKPWDLMAWSFRYVEGEASVSTKSCLQMKQELAVVLSVGGGIQIYFQQKEDGSINEWQVKMMKELAEFCRERQKFCHKSQNIPQIALFYSGIDFYKRCPSLFGPWDSQMAPNLLNPLQGTMRALLDSQNCVEILMEHHLKGNMYKYPLIIVPELSCIEHYIKDEMLEYVKAGGKLLVIGASSAALFEEQLGIKITGNPDEKVVRWLEHGGWLADIKAPSTDIEFNSDTKAVGRIYGSNDDKGDYKPAASIASYGKGHICGVYFDMGQGYFCGANSVCRDFLKELVNELFPEPMVEVKGSNFVDVNISNVDNKLTVNLLNTSGQHSDPNVKVFDEIPEVGPLNVSIRLQEKPRRVVLEPQGEEVSFDYVDGKVILLVKRLKIHSVIVVHNT